MKKYIDPCENCVFYDKEGYGMEEDCYNTTHCRHGIYYKCRSQCPTVQSYYIKCNLGLNEKEDEEVED